MEFFHTGAKTFKGTQTDPFSCLGGFISSTKLPNGRFNNVFNDISRYSDENGGFEVRGIGLMNTTGVLVNGPIYLWFDYESAGVESLSLPRIETDVFFSVTGSSSETIKMVIPSSGLSNSFSLLKSKINDGSIKRGDIFRVELTDSTVDSNVNLYVSSVENMSNGDSVVNFSTPFYSELGLNPALTISLISSGSDFVFDSIIRDSRIRFEVSPVTLSNGKMEIINDIRSLPYVGTFYEPVGEGNKILIANSIPVDGGIGLWFKKEILMPNPLDSVDDDNLEQYLSTLKTEERINLKVEYQ